MKVKGSRKYESEDQQQDKRRTRTRFPANCDKFQNLRQALRARANGGLLLTLP